MLIKTGIIKKDLNQQAIDQPLDTKQLTVSDADIVQYEIQSGSEHVGAITDITKLFCELADNSGVSNKLKIDTRKIKEIAIFAKHLNEEENEEEKILPGVFARSSITGLPYLKGKPKVFEEGQKVFTDLELTIGEFILPGTEQSPLNTFPNIALNLLDFRKKGMRILENDPTKSPAIVAKDGMIAIKALLDGYKNIVQLDGDKHPILSNSINPILNNSINITDSLIHGAQALQTFSDPNSSSYKKIMDGLQAGASGVETLAGTLGTWEKVKQVAGVSLIVLKLVDKIVTLNIGKAAGPNYPPKRAYWQS